MIKRDCMENSPVRPIARVREFATLLGWKGLQLFLHRSHAHGVIPWYQTPDNKFNLQINESPIGQIVRYQATIKADRYGITAMDYVSFELFDDQQSFESEAERIRPYLSRANWKLKTWRDARRLKPGLIMPKSKKKRRGRRRRSPQESIAISHK